MQAFIDLCTGREKYDIAEQVGRGRKTGRADVFGGGNGF